MRQLRYVGQNFFTSFFFLFQSVQFDFTYLRALDTFTFLDWFFFLSFFHSEYLYLNILFPLRKPHLFIAIKAISEW